MDVINYCSRNTFVELTLRSEKRVTIEGNKDVKIDCSSRMFKVQNGQKIWSPEVQYSSKIYRIKDGMESPPNSNMLEFFQLKEGVNEKKIIFKFHCG